MRLEFYKTGGGPLIDALNAESCPDVGEKISIKHKTWKVVSRSWAIDSYDCKNKLRVNLNCERSDDTL